MFLLVVLSFSSETKTETSEAVDVSQFVNTQRDAPRQTQLPFQEESDLLRVKHVAVNPDLSPLSVDVSVTRRQTAAKARPSQDPPDLFHVPAVVPVDEPLHPLLRLEPEPGHRVMEALGHGLDLPLVFLLFKDSPAAFDRRLERGPDWDSVCGGLGNTQHLFVSKWSSMFVRFRTCSVFSFILSMDMFLDHFSPRWSSLVSVLGEIVLVRSREDYGSRSGRSQRQVLVVNRGKPGSEDLRRATGKRGEEAFCCLDQSRQVLGGSGAIVKNHILHKTIPGPRVVLCCCMPRTLNSCLLCVSRQVTVNPRQQVPESNFNNNVARCDVHYTGTAAHVSGCSMSSY